MLNKASKLLLLSIIIFLQSCSNDVKIPASIEATQFLNETYGNDDEQNYDIYLPENRTIETPVIIMVHGGYWSYGDKSDMNSLVIISKNIAPEYAVVNTNYRLATTTSNQHPAQINDISSLIEELQTRSIEFQISNNYYFIGVSSGGHLSLLYAYQTDVNHHVKAVCSITGPTDFLDPAYLNSTNPLFQSVALRFLGVNFEDNQTIYENASPIKHLDASDPPSILFYGDADTIVPISQAIRLKDKLTTVNVPLEYIVLPDVGHDLNGVNYNEIGLQIDNFFGKYR